MQKKLYNPEMQALCKITIKIIRKTLDKWLHRCYNKDTKREENLLKESKGDLIMYDYNITAQEISDYLADMAEMAGEAYFPSDEEMEEMAEYFGEN